MWPILTVLTLLVLASLQWWWRRRFLRAQHSLKTLHVEIGLLNEQHQQHLVQVHNQQEALFDSMVEGVILVDEKGRIELANRAFQELFELTGDVRGKTIMEALRLHELAALLERLGSEGQVLGEELRLPGIAERWLELNAVVLPKAGDELRRAIIVFHDLTRIKKLERTRQEFVANVSHELRTPLSLIKGYAETLLDGAKNNSQVATRFLQTIDRNAERLRLLVEDLLTISELESGRVRLNRQPIDLHEMVERVLADFRSRANARKVTLLNEVSDTTVDADPARLEQVLCNLLDNAIKYGRLEGTVTIGARAIDGDGVEISVRDDGPGLPSEAVSRVFERFYRVDKARSREQGGTGLGLGIVKHIVLSHGGRVWAESEFGHGSTFFLSIPNKTDDDAQF